MKIRRYEGRDNVHEQPSTLSIIQVNNMQIALTDREAECLTHLVRGRSAKQTAYHLAISTRTVETHLENIRRKTNCRTKIELLGKIQNLRLVVV